MIHNNYFSILFKIFYGREHVHLFNRNPQIYGLEKWSVELFDVSQSGSAFLGCQLKDATHAHPFYDLALINFVPAFLIFLFIKFLIFILKRFLFVCGTWNTLDHSYKIYN